MCALIKTIWWPWCRTMGSVGKSPESTWQRRKWMTVRAKLLFIRLIELRERTRYWNFSFRGNVGRGRVSTLKTDAGHDFLKAEFFQRNGTEREKRRREKERASGGAAPAAPPAVQHSTESDITDVRFTWSTIWMLIPLNNHLIWILIELKVNLSEINLSNGRLVT